MRFRRRCGFASGIVGDFFSNEHFFHLASSTLKEKNCLLRQSSKNEINSKFSNFRGALFGNASEIMMKWHVQLREKLLIAMN